MSLPETQLPKQVLCFVLLSQKCCTLRMFLKGFYTKGLCPHQLIEPSGQGVQCPWEKHPGASEPQQVSTMGAHRGGSTNSRLSTPFPHQAPSVPLGQPGDLTLTSLVISELIEASHTRLQDAYVNRSGCHYSSPHHSHSTVTSTE